MSLSNPKLSNLKWPIRAYRTIKKSSLAGKTSEQPKPAYQPKENLLNYLHKAHTKICLKDEIL